MRSDIGYLNTLHEDLRDAAAREALVVARQIPSGRSRRGNAPGGHSRRLAWRLAAAAASIALAAGIGAVATNAGLSGAADGSSAATSSAAGGAAAGTPIPKAAVPLNDESAPSVATGAGAAATGADAADATFGAGSSGARSSGLGSGGAAVSAGSRSIGGGIPDVSKVVKTAELSIVVAPSSFASRFQAATEIADDLGGFVQSSSEAARSGRLVMRVPARSFNAARRELKALGVSVAHESIEGQDVTAQFVDLKARLEILQARKDALVTLLHRATTLETILRLQNVVDDVLTRIEELKGQVSLINDQTSKATISVTMREKGVALAPPVETPSLGSALSHGVAGFLSVVYLVVVGLGYLVPLAIIALLSWLIVRASRRRQASSAAGA
jgi:hypothetical protein